MNRSTGVTVSAVVVFIGCAFTLLSAAFSMLAFVALRNITAQPEFVRYFMVGMAMLEVAFAIWGTLSGIGLLRLRDWARISMVVFSVLLLLFTLPGLLFIPLLPLGPPGNVPENFVLLVKLGMGIFYGLLAALGGWWVYFFNKRSVKDQFRGVSQGAPALVPPRARPLSISIIGWILTISAFFVLPALLMRLPLFFFGTLFTGGPAQLIMLAWCGLQFSAGVGLLRLRPWGRMLAVGTLSLGMLNGLATMLLPGSQVKLQQGLALVMQRLGMPWPPEYGPMAFQMGSGAFWYGIALGMVFIGIQLWFVVRNKQAFHASRDSVGAMS